MRIIAICSSLLLYNYLKIQLQNLLQQKFVNTSTGVEVNKNNYISEHKNWFLTCLFACVNIQIGKWQFVKKVSLSIKTDNLLCYSVDFLRTTEIQMFN